MSIVRNIVVSSKEPTDKYVLWLKPIGSGLYNMLFFFNDCWQVIGGTPGEQSNIQFQFIETIPDINI